MATEVAAIEVDTEAEAIEGMPAIEMVIAAIGDIMGAIMEETIGSIQVIAAEKATITDATGAGVVGIMAIEVADGAAAGAVVGEAGAGTDIGTATGQVLDL